MRAEAEQVSAPDMPLQDDTSTVVPERRPSSRNRLVALAIGLAILPLLVSAVALVVDVGTDYYASADIAGIELRTRDVGRHPVLIGLWSREDWAHPGPALFYLLALPYRLSGTNSIGLHIGALLLNGLAIAGMAVVAKRRGGTPLMILTLLICALLVRSFGPHFLRDPWNPSVPVLAFGLFLFLVWETTCGGRWALPLAAGVGSFCVQNHIGYLPLVVPLLLWAGASLWWLHKRRARELLRPLLVAGLVLVALWTPPLLYELRDGPGNVAAIVEYFVGTPEGEHHTLTEGYNAVLAQFGAWPEWVHGSADLTAFEGEADAIRSAAVPVLILPFALAGIVAWRRRRADDLRLMATLLLALGLGVLAVARTVGPVYHYRLGWVKVVAGLAMAASAWTGWSLLTERAPRFRPLLAPIGIAALVALAAVSSVRAAEAGTPLAIWSTDLEALAPAVAESLPDGGAGDVIFRCEGDESCIYLTGLVLWFERHGFPAMVDVGGGVIGTGAPHRLNRGGPVRAVYHVAIDERFYALADDPGRRVVAYEGAAPSEERAGIAADIAALDADWEAGEIDEVSYFMNRVELSKRLGTAVGIFMES